MNEGRLTIRYVFLIPITGLEQPLWHNPTTAYLNTSIKQDVMKKAFRALDEGTLESQQIGLNVDKSGWKGGHADSTRGPAVTRVPKKPWRV